LRADPSVAAPPLPFETQDGSALGRYLRTFGTAFRPTRSAPAFARNDLGSAIGFFLLSALPLIVLAGIVQHTRSLVFGNGAIAVLGSPSSAEITLDVLRAIGAQLVLSAIELLALLLPYVSLVRANAPAGAPAATRVILYRFWLSPAAAVLGYLAAWLLPIPEIGLRDGSPPPPISETWPLLVVSLGQVALRVLQIIAMSATARLAAGLTMMWTFLAVIVPLLLQILVVPLAADAIEAVLPAAPEPPAHLAEP
jgi:hypothetical protein